MYQERFYRNQVVSRFRLEVSYQQSDLLISTDKKIEAHLVRESLKKYYQQIEDYTKNNPAFLTALSPLADDLSAPPIVRDMLACAKQTGIGPFAAVAGAVAFYVGSELLDRAGEVVIENGGDIFLKINEDKKLGVYWGEYFFAGCASASGKEINGLTLNIRKRNTPFGIASSSASFGHSLNFGRADLVTVIAQNAILADGFATALSNRIKKEEDIPGVLNTAQTRPQIDGILIAFQGKLFIWGVIELAV